MSEFEALLWNDYTTLVRSTSIKGSKEDGTEFRHKLPVALVKETLRKRLCEAPITSAKDTQATMIGLAEIFNDNQVGEVQDSIFNRIDTKCEELLRYCEKQNITVDQIPNNVLQDKFKSIEGITRNPDLLKELVERKVSEYTSTLKQLKSNGVMTPTKQSPTAKPFNQDSLDIIAEALYDVDKCVKGQNDIPYTKASSTTTTTTTATTSVPVAKPVVDKSSDNGSQDSSHRTGSQRPQSQQSSTVRRDGSPDMRLRENRTKLVDSQGAPLRMDGTPDMRYSVNRSSPSSTSSVPLRMDGTPDMRYSVNRSSSSSGYGVPSRMDGMPDMRYAVNRSQPSTTTGMHLRKDGMPDMRFKANRQK